MLIDIWQCAENALPATEPRENMATGLGTTQPTQTANATC